MSTSTIAPHYLELIQGARYHAEQLAHLRLSLPEAYVSRELPRIRAKLAKGTELYEAHIEEGEHRASWIDRLIGEAESHIDYLDEYMVS